MQTCPASRTRRCSGESEQSLSRWKPPGHFQQIPNLKRLETTGKYYRIRLGDYRIGFVFERGTVTFVRCLNRKEIYRYFP